MSLVKISKAQQTELSSDHIYKISSDHRKLDLMQTDSDWDIDDLGLGGGEVSNIDQALEFLAKAVQSLAKDLGVDKTRKAVNIALNHAKNDSSPKHGQKQPAISTPPWQQPKRRLD